MWRIACGHDMIETMSAFIVSRLSPASPPSLKRAAWLLLALMASGASRADACPAGAFGSRDGEVLVLALVDSIPAPGLRYLFRDGRRGSTLDAESPVRCRGDSVEVRLAGARWDPWPRIALTLSDTTFESAGTTLAGRLIEPPSKDKLPLVVMVHGSERTPARASAYATLLAAQGVRVFAYDKRGTGASQGEYTQNFELLAEDAVNALAQARALAAGRYGRAGYFGGSQGGWVAPLAATRAPADFVAVGFGLIVSPIEEDREQMIAEARAAGLDAQALAGIDRLSKATAELLTSHFAHGYEALEALRRDPATRTWSGRVTGEHSGAMLRASDAELRRLGRARFDNVELIWDYDAVAVLERLNVPLLWVLAAEDREAPIEKTRDVLRSLAARGKPVDTWEFPRTDHGMFEFTTRPDGTRQVTRITEGYLRLVADWIRGEPAATYGNGTRLTTAAAPSTRVQVVQAHANAWSSGDLPGLLATLRDDLRSHDRSRDPRKLDGPLSSSIGSKLQFGRYYRETYARQPPSRESISAWAAVGDLVIAAGTSEQPPDFTGRMEYLTAYGFRGDLIRDLWHIAWVTPTSPVRSVAEPMLPRLRAAREANDAASFLALFAPSAQQFCRSGSSRSLAGQPCSPPVESRAEVLKLFAVGDLVVEQIRLSDAVSRASERLSIYRVHDGRIASRWLLEDKFK
jgi:uncharacterized protein